MTTLDKDKINNSFTQRQKELIALLPKRELIWATGKIMRKLCSIDQAKLMSNPNTQQEDWCNACQERANNIMKKLVIENGLSDKFNL